MKEYTLDDAQAVANDLSGISLFLNSASCRENEELQAIIWERLQSQIEHLQSVLSFIEMQPLLKAHIAKEQNQKAQALN
ncbi:DNA polymerase III subunit alpha [Vibrio fluvialis]|uniref:DNA polymerase III subunit alpha n=1 Tax=Vibrio fluvialis TaxID=676 RepID=UPI0028F6CF08|nr:DNA polymerase III subunit alpha [Vibrio fluvialis]